MDSAGSDALVTNPFSTPKYSHSNLFIVQDELKSIIMDNIRMNSLATLIGFLCNFLCSERKINK